MNKREMKFKKINKLINKFYFYSAIGFSTSPPAMAYATNFASLQRLLCRRRLPITSFPTQFSCDVYGSTLASYPIFLLFLYPSYCDKRRLSTSAEWMAPPEFAGMNAYDILGVSRASSFAEIKAAFRKLAKETHPDLAHSQNHSSHASSKFIQILAAYEVHQFFCRSTMFFCV